MKAAILVAAITLVSTPVFAQQIAGYACSDFSPNADGSWSTRRPIQLQANSVGTGEKIVPGVYVGGFNLGQRLNQQCSR